MISRIELIHKVAKLLGDELHGSYEFSGWSIQHACRNAAFVCVVEMERIGWQYGWGNRLMYEGEHLIKDKRIATLDEVEKLLGDRYIKNPPF